jgi:hypothetical protein
VVANLSFPSGFPSFRWLLEPFQEQVYDQSKSCKSTSKIRWSSNSTSKTISNLFSTNQTISNSSERLACSW